MFKRLSWMTMGTGVGFGLAVWCRRAVRARLRRYRPSQMSHRLRTAAGEGRQAMREREQQLRRRQVPAGGEQRQR